MSEMFSPVLSVRDMELKQRVCRLATLERRNPSQMARLLMEDQVTLLEQKKGLPPVAEDKDFQQRIAQQ